MEVAVEGEGQPLDVHGSFTQSVIVLASTLPDADATSAWTGIGLLWEFPGYRKTDPLPVVSNWTPPLVWKSSGVVPP
jgi:hypothetical protein